jgi:hypothetical protein
MQLRGNRFGVKADPFLYKNKTIIMTALAQHINDCDSKKAPRARAFKHMDKQRDT